MKSIICKSIVVAFASAATLASQALAQTNIPTGVSSSVTGSVTATAPKVIGLTNTNTAAAILESGVTISAKIAQPTDVNASFVIRRGVTNLTTKTSFENYVFGNKEILSLVLNTNNPAGYSLVTTNQFEENPGPGVLVAVRSNTYTPVTNSIINPYYFDAVATGSVSYTNDVLTSSKQTVLQGFGVTILDDYGASGVGTATVNSARAVFGTGTNKVTNTYNATSFRGNFQGVSEYSED